VLRGRGVGLALAERTTLAQAAMVRKDIPSCVIWHKEDDEEGEDSSDADLSATGEDDDEEVGSDDKDDDKQVQGEHEELRNGKHLVKATQPTCSKLYCAKLTVAFKSGKWKKQCEHCISLSKNKKLHD
jgi:hypothetical protein